MNLPEPVFIIALPKSYTSVFSAMLGQHPGLVAVPELNLFNGQTVLDWAVQPQNQFLCDGLLRAVAQLVFGAQSAQTVAQALDWLKARSAWKAPQLFDHLRGLVAPAALIDQSPSYARQPAFIHRILMAYPKARFIHMTRNPVSWEKSMEKWGPSGAVVLDLFREADVGPEAATDPISLWHAVHVGIEALVGGLGADRYIRIAGEDTITRTDATLRRVLEWLDLPCNDALLARMHATECSVFANWGPPGARGGNNPDFLTSPALRTRTDRDALMQIDVTALPVPGYVLTYARSIGYR